ncbi:zinc-dependent alcohol dehydrogenase family protein [Aspergillus undulatus]|uniref:zinc-dependent alcohol dehydrogenase family protein n=1 Tax=Aspergillus undulatus TaxID=1810928 RepID=UPI003CCCE293
MARQWILRGQEGFETSLEYQEGISIPSTQDLAADEVLVKMHAVSLNYRELVIAGPMGINGPINPPLVPGCDGSGIVEAVGPSIRDFRPGDRVVTYIVPGLVDSRGDDALPTITDAINCLGQGHDGTLRSFAVFKETGLSHAPKTLDWLSAATLPCTWLTAWNVLFGLEGKKVGTDSWVLVQGTGGVSIAVLQAAVAAGATVVATTSSDEKASRLKSLGAAHVVNYRTNPERWGEEARKLTRNGRGFDHVVDVGGNETFPQALAAIRVDGVLSVVGHVGDKSAEPVPLFAAMMSTCIVRGILGGTRNHLKELTRFIDEKGIVPAVDAVVFELSEAKDAYRRLKEKKHFAKVVIRVDHEA